MSNNNGKQNKSFSQLVRGNEETTKSETIFDLVEYSFSDIEDVEVKTISSGFIVEEGINIFLAPAGSGKTLLLYTLLVNYLRKGLTCVYIDFDNPVDLPKDRGLVDVIKNEGLQDTLYYINTNHYLRWVEKTKGKKKYTEFLKQIFRDIPEGSVVFIDSIQNFVDVNDQNQTTMFMKFLRHLTNLKKATVFAIHHIAKSTGRAKGHTQIEDMADSVYMVKAHKKNSLVESWSLSVSKQRYRTNTELTIKLLDDFDFEVSDVAILDNTTLAILRYAVSLIRKSEGQMKQGDLRLAIKKKFESVGNNRIHSILKEFTDKGLFVEITGVKNAKYYEVNEDSPYIKLLFENDLPEVKKELLNTLKEIDELAGDIEIKDKSGTVKIYKTKEAIKRDIYRMTDEQAKELLKQIESQAEEGVVEF